jgi:hypothetical protein
MNSGEERLKRRKSKIKKGKGSGKRRWTPGGKSSRTCSQKLKEMINSRLRLDNKISKIN